jgi:hypothetical protein
MSRAFPARLHVLLASQARAGVVFRRGPVNAVCTIGWNLETDKFELGQWLRGRIYERRGDLSPDGRHLIYFARGGRRHPGRGAQPIQQCGTVPSRPCEQNSSEGEEGLVKNASAAHALTYHSRKVGLRLPIPLLTDTA